MHLPPSVPKATEEVLYQLLGLQIFIKVQQKKGCVQVLVPSQGDGLNTIIKYSSTKLFKE